MDLNWIGDRIRDIRKSLDVTGMDLAQKCGIGQSTISQIETHRQIPNIETLIIVLDALGVSLSEFFADEFDKQSPEFQRLINAAKRLTPEQCEIVTTLIETLVPKKEQE